MCAVGIEDWSFDTHNRNRATDLDVDYDAPIHNWDAMAQRELEDREQPEVNTDTTEPVK